MGGAVLLLVLGLAVGILQVMLFFKIWAMTDNVEKIYKLLKKNILLKILIGRLVQEFLIIFMKNIDLKN